VSEHNLFSKILEVNAPILIIIVINKLLIRCDVNSPTEDRNKLGVLFQAIIFHHT